MMLRVPFVVALVFLLAEGCAATARSTPPVSMAPRQPNAVAPTTPVVTTTASVVAPSQPARWADIYATYLAPGTTGGCGRSRPCHADVMADAGSAYTWLAQRGYIAGAQSPLVSKNSCLRWFGGNMPPRGEPNEAAVRELQAWVAAGAPEN
jgi:hypothetical protein